MLWNDRDVDHPFTPFFYNVIVESNIFTRSDAFPRPVITIQFRTDQQHQLKAEPRNADKSSISPRREFHSGGTEP
jgi:hypothetical protein